MFCIHREEPLFLATTLLRFPPGGPAPVPCTARPRPLHAPSWNGDGPSSAAHCAAAHSGSGRRWSPKQQVRDVRIRYLEGQPELLLQPARGAGGIGGLCCRCSWDPQPRQLPRHDDLDWGGGGREAVPVVCAQLEHRPLPPVEKLCSPVLHQLSANLHQNRDSRGKSEPQVSSVLRIYASQR